MGALDGKRHLRNRPTEELVSCIERHRAHLATDPGDPFSPNAIRDMTWELDQRTDR